MAGCTCRRHVVCAPCLGLHPVVRVDDVLLFPGGTSRELTDDERGSERLSVDPRSGERTPLVGEQGCTNECAIQSPFCGCMLRAAVQPQEVSQ